MMQNPDFHPEIATVEGVDALGQEAARRFVAASREAAEHGQFTVALSGGNTPRALYQALASEDFRREVDWEHTQVFFSDERFVPPDSAESNFHTAQKELLSKVPIPERFVHRVSTVDIEPEQSAALYEEGILRVFHAAPADAPRFDLILLGMGPDGHTASLFPDTAALNDSEHLVVPNFVPRMDAWRISFTFRLINAAAQVMFLVQGEDKRQPLADVLSGSSDLPAGRVHPSNGKLTWLVDRAALPGNTG